MKTMKKLFALTLAMMMVFSLALSANAANLTVDGALKGAKYNMYQMATVSQNTNGSIVYYSTSAWEAFWTTTGATWFDFDATTKQVSEKSDANMAAAAAAAKDYAVGLAVTKTATATTDETPSAAFTEVESGYYLMTSDKGSLCTLATITNDTTIEEKNDTLPNISKTVDDAEVAIGDEVTFTLSITTGENHDNEMGYVIHDTMTDGLELQEDTIVVKHGNDTLNLATDYTIDKNCADNCTFAIVFTETLTTAAYETITVTYKATVTSAINNTAINTAKIEDSTSTVTVTTTEFTLTKTDGNTALDGAKFELYVGTTTGVGENAVITYTKIPVVKDGDDYRPAVTADEKEKAEKIVAGSVTVKGLDPALTYYVMETDAPAGYVKIDGYNLVKDGTVTVVNVKGEELPETGGMGTTLFYALGGLMVAAAAVMLITKKRMSAM